MYDAEYFLHGRASGKSLYDDYRWLPELTIPMCQAICEYLNIYEDEPILDFGCARGYSVKAFRQLGFTAYGEDISEWALMNCDPEIAAYVGNTKWPDIDWIIAKDVLEHIPQVADTINSLLDRARLGVFAVVPLSLVDGQPYVVPEYEQDVTHIHRLSLATWLRFFLRPGWEVTASYAVPGIKENYAQHAYGNGFITARRL